MSELPSADTILDHTPESLAAVDNTHPSAQVVNDPEPQLVPTAPNSQEVQNLTPNEIPVITQVEPHSEWQILRDHLRENPYDPERWNKLVDLAENNADLDQI